MFMPLNSRFVSSVFLLQGGEKGDGVRDLFIFLLGFFRSNGTGKNLSSQWDFHVFRLRLRR